MFIGTIPDEARLLECPIAFEAEIIPLCEAEGISQIVWSPLAQGLLTGKYKPGQAPASATRAASRNMGAFFREAWLERRTLEAVQRLEPLAAAAGLTMAQFALAWVLRLDNVAAAIVGASRPEQIEDNAGASGHQVDPSLFREAERTLSAVAAY